MENIEGDLLENGNNKEKKKVKFILSPTGVCKLGYNIGDIADLPISLATELIESKFAEAVD